MNKKDLGLVLNTLNGKSVTNVIAGGSNGSIIILDIGEPEFYLFIKCSWRLEQGNSILTGWNESNDPLNGNMTRNIKQLIGDKIKKIQISKFFDLRVCFSNNKILNVFCDVTPQYEPEDYDENWVMCDIVHNKSFVINNQFRIIERPFE